MAQINVHLLKITKISNVGRHGHEESERTLTSQHVGKLCDNVETMHHAIIFVPVVVIIVKVEVALCQNTIYFDIDGRSSWLNVSFNLTNLATCKTE